MRRLTTLIGLMLLLTLPLLLTAQESTLPPVNPATVQGDISTASSGEAASMVNRLANIMTQFGYGGTITATITDHATAFDQFCRSELDIVGASRFILDTEAQSCIGLGREAAGFTIASGALFVVVSPQNTFLNDITTDELRRAFTTANNWSDVRADLPAEPINRYIPPQGSSALVNFANALFDGNTSQLLTALGTRALGTDALLQAIQTDPNALGIVPGAAVTGSSSARVMTINGIRPDATTVSSGQYPLGYPIVLYASPTQMQTQSQIAAFINFAITNAALEAPGIGLYPASPTQLETARATWFNVVGSDTSAEPQLSEPAATATALALLSEIEPQDGEVIDDFPEPTPEPGPFDGDEVVVLVDARADLELLAIDQLGAQRPEGWSGLLDVNNPQLPLLLRLDLELLAGSQLGVDTRPVGWFGAVRSSSAAIARDIRHDLELLADTLLGIGVRPSAWTGPRDPIVRCDRSTQSLVNLLRRGNFFAVDLDASSPTFCADVAIAANRFVEENLLVGDNASAIFNAPVSSAAPTGAIVVDTQFAVAFLDRFATLNVGVVPLGTAVSPVARSYTQFSNMTLIQGEGFLVFVDWRDTTLTEQQFRQLPNFEEVNARPFCTALFCR